MSASRVFAPIVGTHHHCKLHSVKTILGTNIYIGAVCSDQMQEAQGQDLHRGGALVQTAFGHSHD